MGGGGGGGGWKRDKIQIKGTVLHAMYPSHLIPETCYLLVQVHDSFFGIIRVLGSNGGGDGIVHDVQAIGILPQSIKLKVE